MKKIKTEGTYSYVKSLKKEEETQSWVGPKHRAQFELPYILASLMCYDKTIIIL